MTSSFVGQQSILDFLMSQTRDLKPGLSAEEDLLLRNTLTKFMNKEFNYQHACKIFNDCVGSPSVVELLNDILTADIEYKETYDYYDSDYSYDSMSPQVSSSGRKRARPWTSSEDKKLLAGILYHGTDNWNIVSEIVGESRTRAQCSQRWFRGLDPRISKKKWTQEEDEKLMEKVNEFGDTSWAKIANAMGNRSDVQCRYHYQQLIKSTKKQKKAKTSQKQTINGDAKTTVSSCDVSLPHLSATTKSHPFINQFITSDSIVVSQIQKPRIPAFPPLVPSILSYQIDSSLEAFLSHFG